MQIIGYWLFNKTY